MKKVLKVTMSLAVVALTLTAMVFGQQLPGAPPIGAAQTMEDE